MTSTSVEAHAKINDKIDKIDLINKPDEVGEQVRVRFIATQPEHSITSSPIHIPTNIRRYELSEVINKILENDNPITFEFTLLNNVIRGTLASHILKHNLDTENVLEIEYFAAGPTFTKQTVCEYQDWISGISVSNDNDLIFSSSFGGKVSIWNCSGEHLTENTKNSQLNTIINLPIEDTNDHYIVTGSENFNITLDKYNSQSSQITPILSGRLQSPLITLQRYNNNSMFFSGCYDGTIQLWDILLSRDDLHSQTPSSLHSSLYTTHSSFIDDNSPSLHDSKTSKIDEHSSGISSESKVSNTFSPLMTFPGKHTSGVSSIKMVSNYVYSSSYDNHIIQWDTNKNTSIHSIDTNNSILCMDSSPFFNGVLVTGHTNNCIKIHDIRSSDDSLSGIDPLAKISGTSAHSSWVSQVKWAPANLQNYSYFFASASYDGSVKIWDIRTLSPVFSLNAAPRFSKIFALDWRSSPSMLLVGGQDCKLKFFY